MNPRLTKKERKRCKKKVKAQTDEYLTSEIKDEDEMFHFASTSDKRTNILTGVMKNQAKTKYRKKQEFLFEELIM